MTARPQVTEQHREAYTLTEETEGDESLYIVEGPGYRETYISRLMALEVRCACNAAHAAAEERGRAEERERWAALIECRADAHMLVALAAAIRATDGAKEGA